MPVLVSVLVRFHLILCMHRFRLLRSHFFGKVDHYVLFVLCLFVILVISRFGFDCTSSSLVTAYLLLLSKHEHIKKYFKSSSTFRPSYCHILCTKMGRC